MLIESTTDTMESEISIAIIGGGIAGLVCGARLKQLNINNVTVFDTGKHAPGGRCSSRKININGKIQTFDHSAQYFTVSDPSFANIVSFLYGKGVLKIWDGPIGTLKSGHFEPDKSLTQAFVGVDGMESIPMCLASLVNVVRPAWVRSVVWETSACKWKVDNYGFFDYLVIAHNGKCADNLMSNAGVPVIHRLLQVRFTCKLNPQDTRMQLCSLWALLVAFPHSLNLPYEGAHVEDNTISWIANNTAKLSLKSQKEHGSCECWTIFSTKEFATANKVPQENIPPNKAKEVVNTLLKAFGNVTALRDKLPTAIFTKVQLWGAAVPLNVWKSKSHPIEGCIFDGSHHIGICGDWLVSPCIQGAAVSGMKLAELIHRQSKGDRNLHTGLSPAFESANGHSIGCFETDKSLLFKPRF